MRVSHFIMIILLLIPVVQASDQTYSFKMENNSGLSFDNGTFLIEVVELLPSYYAKVNMTSWGTSKFYNLWDGEPIKYDRVTVNASFITYNDDPIGSPTNSERITVMKITKNCFFAPSRNAVISMWLL
ncbi:MAG: hypothetical protein KKA10_05845 [Euryarchaeota archaeon]|nr:hypothetical protein [Euryarchaeota archaeon]